MVEIAWEEAERLGAESPPEGPSVPMTREEVNALLVGVPLETNEFAVEDASLADEWPPTEDEPAHFPSTDPVITSDEHGNIEVLGGFELTALSVIEVEPSAEEAAGGVPGDEALTDAVRHELRADASTTDLRSQVKVQAGIVHL